MDTDAQPPLETLDSQTLVDMLAKHRQYLETQAQAGKEIELEDCVVNNFDFSGLNLSGLQAQGAMFNNCRFVGTDLFGASFSGATAHGADFQRAWLAKAEIWNADFRGTNFTEANLIILQKMMADTIIKVRQVPEPLDNETLQRMMDAHMSYVNAHNGSGSDIDLSLYIISDFDFSGLNLQGMHAQKTTFHRCRFVGTDFYGADFDGTVAPGADFREAILAKAVFYKADVSGANFDNANLIRVNFMNCDLRRATFRNADFSGGWVSECNMEGAVYDPEPVQII